MPLACTKPARGFTLVEVLVALMIMALLAGMAWQGVDGIVRTRDASQARLEQTLRLNTVLAQLDHDLQALHDTGVVPGVSFDGAHLRVTRQAAGGVQIVTWSLYPSGDGTPNGSLLRWAGTPVRTSDELQESWMRTYQFQGQEPGQLRTLTGVAKWQVYCYRSNSWSNCQSSGDVAAATNDGDSNPPAPRRRSLQQLPSGVRFVLQFEGPDLTGALTRDIALGPQAR